MNKQEKYKRLLNKLIYDLEVDGYSTSSKKGFALVAEKSISLPCLFYDWSTIEISLSLGEDGIGGRLSIFDKIKRNSIDGFIFIQDEIDLDRFLHNLKSFRDIFQTSFLLLKILSAKDLHVVIGVFDISFFIRSSISSIGFILEFFQKKNGKIYLKITNDKILSYDKLPLVKLDSLMLEDEEYIKKNFFTLFFDEYTQKSLKEYLADKK